MILHCNKRGKGLLLHWSQVNDIFPKTHCLEQGKRTKKRFPLCCQWNPQNKTSVLVAFQKSTATYLAHEKKGEKKRMFHNCGCTRPQNNMFKKSKTSTPHILQQLNTTTTMNTTYSRSFTTWMAQKWCLPSQITMSIPSLMWEAHSTIKCLSREMHTTKYRALYKS